MIYEKKRCPTCGATVTNVDLMLMEAEKTLPEGFRLYDFGGGMSIVPKPDTMSKGYFDNRYMIGLENVKKRTVTLVSIDYYNSSTESFAKVFQKALEYNKTQTEQIQEIKEEG